MIRARYGVTLVGGLVLACVTASAAAEALVSPTRSLVAPARVLTLGLTGRHVAVAVGTTPRECPHVQLWLTESNDRYRFPTTLLGCKDGPSTGFGIPFVELAKTRVLWLSYIGGNLRDWQLWTATPTRRTPRRLRFVERDVDAPAPIVLGPGTPEGVPYAVDREVVYLGEGGKAIFRTTVASPVRAIAAGSHPVVRVAVLLANGWVVGLDRAGNEYTAEPFPVGAVSALRVTALGVAVQVGSRVEITPPRRHDGVVANLPSGSAMLDVAQSRILYQRAGDLWAKSIATGTTTRLVDATTARPAYGQIEQQGIAWSKGPIVSWRAGRLP